MQVGVLSFIQHTRADRQWMECVQADPLIEITDRVLEQADESFVSQGDGIVTFHWSNGDVSYGLLEHDALRECWLARRSDVGGDSDSFESDG